MNAVHSSRLVFVALVPLLMASPAAGTQSLDAHLTNLARAAKAGDAVSALDSLEGAAVRLGELQQQTKDVRKVTGGVLDTLDRASKALAQEPFELGPIVDMIAKDTARLNDIKPVAPAFGDPLQGVTRGELETTDPGLRGKALDNVRARGEQLRRSYTEKLDKLRKERNDARSMERQAAATDERGYEVEKLLEQINDSPAGVFFNIQGGKLVYSMLDMTLYVRPALADRLNAAQELVRRYDGAIVEMEKTLTRYKSFDDWAGFYRWQDWARSNVQSGKTTANPPSSALNDAKSLLQSAKDQAATANKGTSREQTAVTALIEETTSSTNATKEKAQRLVEAANRADARAAAKQEAAALLNLATAIANAGTKSSAQKKPEPKPTPPPPLVIINKRIEFKLVVPPSPVIEQRQH
jgi:hypothetical protein